MGKGKSEYERGVIALDAFEIGYGSANDQLAEYNGSYDNMLSWDYLQLIGPTVPASRYHTGAAFLREGTLEERVAAVSSSARLAGGGGKFKTPVVGGAHHKEDGILAQKERMAPRPRHNPDAENALVMLRPSSAHALLHNPRHLPVVAVVIDPVLSTHLRPHQREGVKFLYECVAGLRDFDGRGAILADEMGLGKTIQAITLIWTVLKQSPYYGEGGLCKRALVVCPASLVQNWHKEFKKWLGDERIRVFAVDAKSALRDFLVGKVYQVMVVGYERLRLIADELGEGVFDLIVCDEGHRLKNQQIKITATLNALKVERRVILSGTPIQNDLGECEINRQYLPPKTELVLFCKPSTLQREMYTCLLASSALRATLEGQAANHLRCIAALKQLCNVPEILFRRTGEAVSEHNELFEELQEFLPDISKSSLEVDVSQSGKLQVLVPFLGAVRDAGEKVVLVSNSTKMLDVLEKVCLAHDFKFLRLDGTTLASKRHSLVERQIMKQQLSGAMMDEVEDTSPKFSTDELRDLFTLHSDTDCQTHDLLECQCLAGEEHGADGEDSGSLIPAAKRRKVVPSEEPSKSLRELREWLHVSGPNVSRKVQDDILSASLEMTGDVVSFAFTRSSY
ncbi:DNA repair and recombination protein rad54b [Gonapodya sp. JEL0774]|nr:DNA repair and recombination protein rad54b [Gonapodya sp. JEL0774]